MSGRPGMTNGNSDITNNNELANRMDIGDERPTDGQRLALIGSGLGIPEAGICLEKDKSSSAQIVPMESEDEWL